MCLIAYKPKAEKINWKALHTAFVANPDGCGYMLRYKGEIYWDKGIWTWDDFKRQVYPYRHLELAIHFRIATHGPIVDGNCHPFDMGDWVVMHNGMVDGFGGKERSDTAHFAEYLHEEYGKSAPHFNECWDWMTGWSKFVFALPGNDPWVIVGEDAGIWENGIWYSNASFRPRQARTAIPAGFCPWQYWERKTTKK